MPALRRLRIDSRIQVRLQIQVQKATCIPASAGMTESAVGYLPGNDRTGYVGVRAWRALFSIFAENTAAGNLGKQ